MTTKLKFLKAYFTREIIPAVGDAIGKILYTAKNVTGRRKQYVIDVLAKKQFQLQKHFLEDAKAPQSEIDQITAPKIELNFEADGVWVKKSSSKPKK